MRLMMQGLTDAAFEQRFGAEDAWPGGAGSGAAGGRHGVPTLRQSKELRLWEPFTVPDLRRCGILTRLGCFG
jgi:hypothetical protein